MGCPFCEQEEVIIENKYAFAVYDKHPVNPGHILVIPKRHFADYFEAKFEEVVSMLGLVDKCKEILEKKYKPEGYNLGINIGIPAGQTVMHMHMHLIPRYEGDIDDPKGGVRAVIPKKRIY